LQIVRIAFSKTATGAPFKNARVLTSRHAARACVNLSSSPGRDCRWTGV